METKSIQKVYASFPDTGLGNKLLIWAKAFAFAQKHQLELFCGAWWGIHFGSWIRNEKQKRLYLGYFHEDSWMKRVRLFFYRQKARKVNEPVVLEDEQQPVLYCFREVITSKDYFEQIKPYRTEVKEALYAMLQPSLTEQLNQLAAPTIAVHVRRGDFKLGSTLTPLSFFIDSITAIRNACGSVLPVTVFTDAHAGEIAELLALPAVQMSVAKADILDILLMSRSKVCLLSISSTFSFWGGFLSDGIVLMHPEEWHPSIRPDEVNRRFFEGKFDPSQKTDPVLLQQIQKLVLDQTLT
ncbi:hypothetical protein ESA94_15035 [Lacibacter luteus]|uniref:Alpha-1,2-fucosyltransferase n=1 Tax=Lacibacter luteus TaxID=2508719 RepID=A0A4Q1CHQ2_9BACT|nr:hypothetical protein [Lacibacter luteus]RXK59446.1 hypothetical protein ESA94_15035 [Lacibacter luteus]